MHYLACHGQPLGVNHILNTEYSVYHCINNGRLNIPAEVGYLPYPSYQDPIISQPDKGLLHHKAVSRCSMQIYGVAISDPQADSQDPHGLLLRLHLSSSHHRIITKCPPNLPTPSPAGAIVLQTATPSPSRRSSRSSISAIAIPANGCPAVLHCPSSTFPRWPCSGKSVNP